MMEAKDWISLLVGAIVFCMGLFPILNTAGIGPSWFSLNFLSVQIFMYLLAIGGFYLVVESVIEITNSNVVGWWSFIIAALIMALGILQVLNNFAIGPSWFAFPWLSQMIYYIIFMVLGFFLMVACFAMEL